MSKKNEAKELWRDAGLWLDLKKKLTPGDWDKIEAHIDGFAATSDKIFWLEKFLILFDEATAKRIDGAFNANPGMWEGRAQAIRMDAEVFRAYVHKKLAVFKAWCEAEKREEPEQREKHAPQEAATSPAPIAELEAKSQTVEDAEPPHGKLESLRKELENVDYSDLENIKRELQNRESLENKMRFLSRTGMAIKHEFAAAEKEWVDAGHPIRSPLWDNKERWGMTHGKILPWIGKTYEKYRCWLRLRTGKELWPGAGIDLDLKNIRDDDGPNVFELVEERLKSLPDYETKIAFLKRFMILLRHESGMGENDHGSASKGARHLYDRCESAVSMFEQLAELESDDSPASDARGKPEFSAAQCCMVIHYLVREARELERKRRDEGRRSSGVKETAELIGDDDNTRDKAFERLLVALTGWKEDAIRKGRGKMFSRRKQTPEDLKLVKSHFQGLGLSDIVKLIESAPVQGGHDDDDDDDEI